MAIHYSVYIVPADHSVAANRLFNLMLGGDGDNFGNADNATGSPNDSVTHWDCAIYQSLEELQAFQGLWTAIPDPAGGWPFMGITLADAQAAVAAMVMTTRSAATSGNLGAECLAAALSASGLQRVVYPVEF